jgi:hypothetical protein
MTLFLLGILLVAPLSAATTDTATASQPLETTRQQSVADLKERSATLLKAYPDLLKESGFWPISTCAFGTTDRNLLGAQGKIPAATWPLARNMGVNFVHSILLNNELTLSMGMQSAVYAHLFGHVSAYPKLPVRQLGAYALANLAVNVVATPIVKRQITEMMEAFAALPSPITPQATQNFMTAVSKPAGIIVAIGSIPLGITLGMMYHRYSLDKKYRQQAHQLLVEIKQQKEKAQPQLISGNSQ